MSELERRKQKLIVESEAYRELLKLEIQNLRISSARTARRAAAFRHLIPVLMGIPALSKGVFRKRKARKKSSLRRIAGAAILGWQAYHRFGGLFRDAIWLRRRRPQSAEMVELTRNR